MVEKISPCAGLKLGTARSVDQHLTHRGTRAPGVGVEGCGIYKKYFAQSCQSVSQYTLCA